MTNAIISTIIIIVCVYDFIVCHTIWSYYIVYVGDVVLASLEAICLILDSYLGADLHFLEQIREYKPSYHS